MRWDSNFPKFEIHLYHMYHLWQLYAEKNIN